MDKPLLIAEIGINHNGDLQIAKKLIDATFACDWDVVKFQKRNPDLCVPEHQKGVIKNTPWGKMTYLEYKKILEFGKKEYDYIDKYCKEKPIEWTASVWDLDSLFFMLNYNPKYLKIPSAKLTEDELLNEIALNYKGTIILSTGMSTLEEIDRAFQIITKHTKNLVLLHTNSVYPSPMSEINLLAIRTLKKRYDLPVGYSGHEFGLEPTVISASLGVSIIERHITLSHDLWGTDQASSLEIHAMFMLKNRINDVILSLGDGVKKVTDKEKEILKKLRG